MLILQILVAIDIAVTAAIARHLWNSTAFLIRNSDLEK